MTIPGYKGIKAERYLIGISTDIEEQALPNISFKIKTNHYFEISVYISTTPSENTSTETSQNMMGISSYNYFNSFDNTSFNRLWGYGDTF